MKNYRILSIMIFLSALIQLAFGIFIKLTEMIGEPESTWVFIALVISTFISAAIAVFFLIRSNR